MSRRLQIGVIGSEVCTARAEMVAAEVGREIARRGHITLTGGLGGVMAAAARGAAEAGGLAIGILPGLQRSLGNPFNHVNIATGLGKARNAIVAQSVDGLIVIQGGTGTLSEMCMAYETTPIVAMHSTGGVAAKFAGEYLDSREIRRIMTADSAEDAIRTLLDLVERANGTEPEV